MGIIPQEHRSSMEEDVFPRRSSKEGKKEGEQVLPDVPPFVFTWFYLPQESLRPTAKLKTGLPGS